MTFPTGKFVSFDFETSGELPEYALQPWRITQGKAWATSLAWVWRPGNRLVAGGGLNPTVEMMRGLLEDCIANKRTLVGWNTAFDIAILIAYGLEELVMQCKFLDGVLLWRHFDLEPEYETDRSKKRSYGLKTYVKEHLKWMAGYEEEIDFHDPSPEARRKLHKYNVQDNIATFLGVEDLLAKLSPAQRRAAIIEAECLPLIARANHRGMVIDTLTTHDLQGTLAKTAVDQLAKLAEHGVTEKIVRSPIQLANLIYDQWGLPVLKENTGKKTGKISRATDKEVLHELAFLDPRAAELRKYREALNNKTKFADALLDSAEYNEDGCAHPQAIVFGTYSGRLTYSSSQGTGKAKRQTGFALHQEKNDKKFRSAVTVPQGYTLMEFDAAGQEFRWMGIASGDDVMLNLCAPGEDPHSYMASRICDRDYRELISLVHLEDALAAADRKLGKVANLCVAEGTQVLTDRGLCSIELVRSDDLVWDGLEFVKHDGVVFSGVKPVITYSGLTATPDHKVLVDGCWVELQDAARHGWCIEPALGAGWSGSYRAAVRVVGGIVRRAVSEVWGALRPGALRLRHREGCQPAHGGGREVGAVQGLRVSAETSSGRGPNRKNRDRQETTETRQRLVPEMREPQGQILPQLRRAWDQVLFFVGVGRRSVYQGGSPAPDISETGHRQDRQRWPLRAREPAAGHTQSEPRQQNTARVYDITNCGPRTRFAANGLIVHNSLQYRTSARKLRVVARVQYNLPMEMPQAQRIHATYQRAYPGVPRYWNRQIYDTKRSGYVETFAGRRVRVVGDWDGRSGWSMASTAINYRIQGTGADQKYLAMAVIKPYLTRIGAYFAWDLHDGIYLYVPTHMVQQAAIEIKRLLDNLPYRQAWGFTPPIPLPWDVKAGPSWGALKEVKL